jgi:YfiH family protein
MRVAPPFRLQEGAIALDLPGGSVRFTTRAAPSPEALSGIPHARQAQSPQVHGALVRVIRGPADLDDAGGGFDGQATALREVACIVRVADCLPVALVAPEAVAMLHAGWRGLDAGILEAGVAALRGLDASEMRAAIGPGAGVCCYEAGEEVHAAFADAGAVARRGANVDLKAIARARLHAAGVEEIHDAAICTICADPADLWSFRREGEAAGRQLGVAWRS